MKIRLDKYLADMTAAARSEVKKQIAKGLVKVDGQTVRRPEAKVDTKESIVCLEGTQISYTSFVYYMMNKPSGVVSATQDKSEKTVLSLMEAPRKDLFPAGRLDKDTEGLLLLTNDGGFAHRILSPKKHVDKIYYAKIEGPVTEADVDVFAEGMDIGEKRRTLPGKLKILFSGEISEIELTIQEGKFHQVKRMFQAIGKRVLYLKRIQMGNLRLDETLKPGEYRELTEEEKEKLC
ncbi:MULTISPECIES: pseudouridine synthase [Lachnospiraceae]|jgi:16S rRNA pseudouridine516 synthase|uniref:Pseudouridine synthase n=1 Tax=Faecalicatena acetigenes TaxID=2981790 RepID=A0ABT2T8R9_9FIRM|nr:MULTISPECIES: pseudouridine synthase [Lachnospiraceae]MCU6746657.1 rRNA pseudouridine synthase [Faecalicatena acetigenes]RGT74492.1 rRNA pseudouridine synthase [Ruminococcus sp. AF18-22]SCH34661.1 Ribosomal small subunit pseudouridine synthase A [uncultured Clostridium sp.]